MNTYITLVALAALVVSAEHTTDNYGVTTCTGSQFKDVCVSSSLCECQTEDEILDLSPLYDEPDMITQGILPNIHFEFNPCKNFTTGKGCNDVLMCEHQVLRSDVALGYPASAKVSKCKDSFVLRYAAGQNQADVYLTCDENTNGTLRYLGRPVLSRDYRFELRSSFACTTKLNVSTTSPNPTSTTNPTKTTSQKSIPTSKTTASTTTPTTSPSANTTKTTSKTTQSTKMSTTTATSTPTTKTSKITTASSTPTSVTTPSTTNTTPGTAVSLKSSCATLLIFVAALARSFM